VAEASLRNYCASLCVGMGWSWPAGEKSSSYFQGRLVLEETLSLLTIRLTLVSYLVPYGRLEADVGMRNVTAKVVMEEMRRRGGADSR
jgi:hypothetical protein